MVRALVKIRPLLATLLVSVALGPACSAEKHGASSASSAQPPTAAIAAGPSDQASAPAHDAGDDAVKPEVGQAAAEDVAPDAAAAAAATKTDTADEGDDEAAVELPRRVLILGDSLAATGFGALLEKRLAAHPDIECFRKAKSSSGLARPDFFDWMGEAKRQVDARDPHLVVVIIGGNDGQDLTTQSGKGKRVQWKTDEWGAAYGERMDEFLTTIAGEGRQVLWLGLPKMGLASFEKKLELIRAVQAERVAGLGARGTYVDTIPLTSDDSGELLQVADVGSKKRQKLRADDKIHFTMAGSAYFADQVYPEVLQALGLEDRAE